MNLDKNLFLFRTRLQPLTPIFKKFNYYLHDRCCFVNNNQKHSLSYFVIIFILSCISGISSTYAQQHATPQGTSNNVFPFGSTSSNKVQWLYTPSDFTTVVPSGNISRLYFRTWNGTYSATYGNFTIKLGTTTATTFANGTFLTGLTPVYGPATYTVPSTGPYTWFYVDLTSPFVYTAGMSLVVEIEQNSLTGSITANCHSTAGRRIYGTYGSTSGTMTSGMGDIGLDIVNPCVAPSSAPTVSGITSTSATLTWGTATPSIGYTYVLSTSSTPPPSGYTTIPGTTYNATSLTPATVYHMHVRNNCSTNSWSVWQSRQFTTNPPCSKRNLQVKDITTDGAKIVWNKETYGIQYEYFLKTNANTPTGSGIITTDSTFTADQLAEGTKYYVYVRMYCPGGEISEWALDSFTTRTICRPPNLSVDHIEADRAVVYWNPMPTALSYEYEVSQSPTPLGKGTEILKTNFYVYPLKDGQPYYFHVRSRCNDQGFISQSEWTTTAFQTFPASVHGTRKNSIAISVHPNPLKDAVTISIAGRADKGKITIANMSGQTVHTTEVLQNSTIVDMKHLPAGVYIMRYADDNYSETIRLMKQ